MPHNATTLAPTSASPPSQNLNTNLNDEVSSPIEENGGMTRTQAWGLYASHILSTWNIRTYEFAVIIFTAATYPDTLIASSVRGIISTLSSIFFSPSIGRWVDTSPNRLTTLRTTITLNRLSIITSTIFWYLILHPALPNPPIVKTVLFTLLLLLSIIETLSGTANLLSMERDFIVEAAGPDGGAYDLTTLNSGMRRCDLCCKLFAPVFISGVISMSNVSIGVLVVGGMSLISWALEIYSAKRVWDTISKLRVLKSGVSSLPTSVLEQNTSSISTKITEAIKRYHQDFTDYFSSPVWIPSFCLSLLHLSALSYSATFITFLLSAGFSLPLITIARAVGSVVEISSTVVTPFGVRYLGRAKKHGVFIGLEAESSLLLNNDNERESEVGRGTEVGLERLGLWGMTWQVSCLIPVVMALWSLTPVHTPDSLSAFVMPVSQGLLALIIFSFLSLSRLGLWIYDQTTTHLTLLFTPSSTRSSFTGVESSFIALFALLQHLLIMIFHNPEQFWIIGLVSLGAVVGGAGGYTWWVRGVRGHLVHWEGWGKRGGVERR